jgi:hypothetical protein
VKRPAFQFYPADWRNNAKLRRCSEAARGAWMDVLCVLHDSDEYGVCRWPLVDLARAAGVPIKLVKELATKDVLKGADKGGAPYIYTPRHAGKDGEPVTLVEANDGPCWYCSRFVRDEWVRQRRGQSTQFSSDYQPAKGASERTLERASKKTTAKPAQPSAPKGGLGERQGDGATSSSPSSYSVPVGTDANGTLPSSLPSSLSSPSLMPLTPASKELSPIDALFQIATPWLLDQGVPDKSARSLLGAARKQLGDADAWALASDCMREQPHEPASWIAAALNARMKVKAIAGKSAPRAENFDAVDYGQSGKL